MKKHASFFLLSLLLLAVHNDSSLAALKPKKIEITKKGPSPNGYGRVYVTNDLKTNKPVENFDCTDTVYVIVPDVARKGRHKLEVYWIPPSSGARQEYTKADFAVETMPMDAYALLKFNDGLVGRLFSGIDPSARMEKFIGRWKVKVYMDEKLIANKSFFVIC
ncbi:MAG: hypothetical protein HY265_03040 [Deltaproteobacteria bacterium]|nr:hypothetical protein [Deltaproteobacteria bacterium]